MENREYRLREAISGIVRNTHTSWSIARRRLTSLPLNALAASDSVIVPIQCEYLASKGYLTSWILLCASPDGQSFPWRSKESY